MREQDPMLDVFIFESQQLLESLEDTLLQGERAGRLDDNEIHEVFRVMHTIKGSASMMAFENLSMLAHAVEDLFAQIREEIPSASAWDKVFELVLAASDNIKAEIEKIATGAKATGNFADLIASLHGYLDVLKNHTSVGAHSSTGSPEPVSEYIDYGTPFYKAKITFEPDCQMENIRAFGIVNSLTPQCQRIAHIPEDVIIDTASAEIAANGFVIYLQSGENPDMLKALIDEALFIKTSSLISVASDSEELPVSMRPRSTGGSAVATRVATDVIAKQNFISVNVNKLDKLMDLVGEIVTTESMVTKNPEIVNLRLETFERSSQQLRKLINELQDIVMSIRMVPVSTTFQKMHRIVRDMSKKVEKEVELKIIGEETEVDKNIIDTLSDPLMHIIRNALDHGLESPEIRAKSGKSPVGTITLEARNAGGDVIILVSDDGTGLNRDAILKKAYEHGLTAKSEQEITDKEVYSMIFLPGFSTNETVTEFSGRGVGMDVVRRNIDKVGGSISIESAPGEGTTVQIRIPLTLAIIDGMKLRVRDLVFIVPMLSIRESFKPNPGDVFLDPDGNEMIMIRGECYPIMRLHRIFNLEPEFDNVYDGILVTITTDTSTFCLFVDELIGEQQAVIKPLPEYLQKHNLGMHGIGGCAILGDGSISLIVDINNLVPEE